MNYKTLFPIGIILVSLPKITYAHLSPPANKTILACDSGSQSYTVDITLFPNTIRINGKYLELYSSTNANDGFRVGRYKQAFGGTQAMLALREGYKPVLIEDSKTYICD